MWEGKERRSDSSLLARDLVAARGEAERCESELDEVPRWRFRRRSELRHAAEEAREREEEVLAALGGKASGAAE
jgi:hypothetical protein